MSAAIAAFASRAFRAWRSASAFAWAVMLKTSQR